MRWTGSGDQSIVRVDEIEIGIGIRVSKREKEGECKVRSLCRGGVSFSFEGGWAGCLEEVGGINSVLLLLLGSSFWSRLICPF